MLKKRYMVIVSLSLFIILLDQITKFLAVQIIPEGGNIPVINGLLNLVHVHNRGAAFGFLNRPDIQWQFWLFTATTALAVLVILFLVRNKQAGKRYIVGLACILGGALGNYIDRIRLRHVIDFIDFYIGTLHWPAFNIADIGICVGVGLAILSIVWPGGHKAANAPPASHTAP